MRVLLGSGGFRTSERVQLLGEAMRRHFGNVPRLLFIPYAAQDHDGYARLLHRRRRVTALWQHRPRSAAETA